MPDDDGSATEADRWLAVDVASYLQGDRLGLSLIGPSARTATIVRMLLNRLDPASFRPATFEGGSGTPASLRDIVQRCHDGRPSPDTVMLLVVTRSRRLSLAVLQELDQAAEAAASLGGLKFLFVAVDDPAPTIRDAGFVNLAACLSTMLTLVPVQVPVPVVAPSPAVSQPPRPPPRLARTAPRLLLAAAILAVLVLGLALFATSDRPRQAPPPPATPPVVEAPVPTPLAPPPLASPPPLPPAPPPTPAPPPASAPAAIEPPTQAPPVVPPSETSLLLIAGPGDTLPQLYAQLYRNTTPPPYAQVLALNPIVRPGIRLVFPPPPGGWPKRIPAAR